LTVLVANRLRDPDDGSGVEASRIREQFSKMVVIGIG
jgi:hypothetical protein